MTSGDLKMKNPETNPFSLFFRAISQHYTGLIAIILILTSCALWFSQKEVPNSLENLTYIVVSFLFGRGSLKGSPTEETSSS